MEADEMNMAPDGLPVASFSPVLRGAMQEILAVCRKHDIGAYVLLASKNHTEERTRFPTWSVAQVESEGGRNAIRFRTKDRKKECVPWTLNMLDAFYIQVGMMALNMGEVIGLLKKHLDFETKSRRGPDAPSWDFK